jgi:hypothetical protein
MNGVCVRWRGWIDLERLDGVGCLEYDEDKAQVMNSRIAEHYCSKCLAHSRVFRNTKLKLAALWENRRLAHA